MGYRYRVVFYHSALDVSHGLGRKDIGQNSRLYVVPAFPYRHSVVLHPLQPSRMWFLLSRIT